jgi:hypothetical protein
MLVEGWEGSIHGLRHLPEGGTSGWYCWTGELAFDPDFFVPLHLSHLVGRIPELAEYLALPPWGTVPADTTTSKSGTIHRCWAT